MSTKIIAGIVAVVIVGGSFYYFSDRKERLNAIEEEVAMIDRDTETIHYATQAENKTFNGDLSSLLKQGGNWQCDVKSSTELADANGVVYVSNKRISATFSINAAYVGNVETKMIADGQNVYTWSNLAPTGVKAPQSSLENWNGSAPTSDSYSDQNISYNYNCVKWDTDESVFSLPEITFIQS